MTGPVSGYMASAMEKSSWIRRMFEEGTRLKARLGAENVFDFTLGNPSAEPPAEVIKRLADLALEKRAGTHMYMPNAGLQDVRAQVAEYLSRRSGLKFTESHVIMTVGAGGGLNVALKALLDPGDEVIIAAPYFAEYIFYIANHQGAVKVVQTDERFALLPEAVEAAMGPKTRVVLLNSPNNPTGAVYQAESLAAVGEMLDRKSAEYGRPVYLLMDEPYRKLLYGGVQAPDVFAHVRRAVAVTSHSKDMNLPGERIGYIAIGPGNGGAAAIFDAMTMANRILGFVNAPALFQRLVGPLQDVSCDMNVYAENRRILVEGLTAAGYQVTPPGGGFYLFPKSPIEDDVRFAAILKERNVLVVPGTGFGRAGHFRIAFCVTPEVCRRAVPLFAEAFKSCGVSPAGME